MIASKRLTLRKHMRALSRDTSGMAMIELAFVMPLILLIGLGGLELANVATTQLKVSQIALSVADNAARLGQTDNSGVTPTITQADVDALLDGAMREGLSIDLQGKGRVVVSSLEYDNTLRSQVIRWQRCRGQLAARSAYGPAGTRVTGLGRGATKVQVSAGQAVMFVEVHYRYESLAGYWLPEGGQIRQEAGFIVRDDRNLGPGITGTNSRSLCT